MLSSKEKTSRVNSSMEPRETLLSWLAERELDPRNRRGAAKSKAAARREKTPWPGGVLFWTAIESMENPPVKQVPLILSAFVKKNNN
jgi:hypothetical protein